MQTGMTPRAWRMISYSCIGFLIYGLVLVTEIVQNYHLNKIDKQMEMIEKMERYNFDEESPENSPDSSGAAETADVSEESVTNP